MRFEENMATRSMTPGTVRVTIEVPKPDVEFEGVSWRIAKPADRYLTINGVWEQWPYDRDSTYSLICLDGVRKPIEFPESLPGIKSGPWFAKDANEMWFLYPIEPTRFGNVWHVCNHRVVTTRLLAYDVLNALPVPWDQSKFQTRKDG